MYTNKNLPGTPLKRMTRNMLVCALAFAMIFPVTRVSPVGATQHVEIASSNLPGDISLIPSPDATIPEDEFVSWIASRQHPAGGFQGIGSRFEDIHHAIGLLAILNQSVDDYKTDLLDLLLSRWSAEDGGFVETTGGLLSVESNYHVASILGEMSSLSAVPNASAIQEFLHSSQVGGGWFSPFEGMNDTFLASTFFGLSTLDWLNDTCDVSGMFADTARSQVKAPTVSNYGSFAEAGLSDYEATYMALKVLDRASMLDLTHGSAYPVAMCNYTGSVNGTPADLGASDVNKVSIESSPGGVINTSISFMLNETTHPPTEHLELAIHLNLSEPVDGQAQLLLKNFTDGSYINITASDALNVSGAESQLHFSVDLANFSRYYEGLNNTLETNLVFSHSSPFSLDIDFFELKHTVLDVYLTRHFLNASYIGEGFGDGLMDTYFALRALDVLNWTGFLAPANETMIADHVLALQQADGGFSSVPAPPFSSLEETLAAASILNFTGRLNQTLIDAMVSFLSTMVMPDGGFGDPGQLTLEATCGAVTILHQLGRMDAINSTLLSEWTLGFQANSSYHNHFFFDEDPATSEIEDTCHALLILSMLDALGTVEGLDDISDGVADRQNSYGYFSGDGALAEVYHATRIISITGDWEKIDVASLQAYVISRQNAEGGFFPHATGNYAMVSATYHAVATMILLESREDVMVYDEEQPGVISFIRSYQNPVSGGFFDRNTTAPENATISPNLKSTYEAFSVLKAYQAIQEVNATGVLDFVLGTIPVIAGNLNDSSSYLGNLVDGVHLVLLYTLLEESRLQVLVRADPLQPVAGQPVLLYVTLIGVHDVPIEDGSVVLRWNATRGLEAVDLQNGTYVLDLGVPDQQNFTLRVSHPGYIEWSQFYQLKTWDTMTASIADAAVVFSLVKDVSIIVTNSSDGTRVTNCTVSVGKGSQFITLVEDPSQPGRYAGQLAFDALDVGPIEYTIEIIHPEFRLEMSTVEFHVYHSVFVGGIVGGISCVAIIAMYKKWPSLKHHQPFRFVDERIVQKLRGNVRLTAKNQRDFQDPKQTKEGIDSV